jgi:hypothetical protein
MTSQTRPFVLTGAAFAVAGALIVATPTIGATHDPALAAAPGVASVSSAFQLLSHSEWQGNEGDGNQAQGASSYESDDDGADVEDDGEDHHHRGGGFGNLGGMITSYLDANQAQVLSFSSMVPAFTVFGVTVGNSALANAYYTGIDDGTGTLVTGVDGVLAYVASQRGVPKSGLLQSVIVGVTSLTPQIKIGPVAIGHGLLANAYFTGYDSGSGNVTGLPGVISYVTSQLGIQAAPAGAVKAAASTTSVVAARRAAAVAAPAAAAADNSTPGVTKAASVRAERSVSGRAAAKAASAVRAAAN